MSFSSIFQGIFNGLFGSGNATTAEQMIAGAQIFPQYEGQSIPPMTPDQVSAYQDTMAGGMDPIMPGRLAEGLMREAPPEVMAQFSEEELEADVPLSKAKRTKRTKPKNKPGPALKARKALKRAKARKRKT